MNTSMDKETAAALEEAIAHWKENLQYAQEEEVQHVKVGSDDCPLCTLFYANMCDGCPVSQRTDKRYCDDTPHTAVTDVLEFWPSVQKPNWTAEELSEIAKLMDTIKEEAQHE